MYRYGIKNVFRPTYLAPKPYAWTSAPGYNRADIPTGLMQQPSGLTQEQFMQQFAYEWFQSSSINAYADQQWSFSNPPFVSGAAGRLMPSLQAASGGSPRILRGYIRRAQHDVADSLSRCRLYFMYNPEVIMRDYVSYLEQGALDPFNTVYQSGNDVAPPSILDFSFELFFDRQEEATQLNHPGVFVDYQFFDMVVRNVVPTDPNQSNNALPDNGVMMVNPRDITVIFSPQMSIQGRPLNARVSFERFTHRMTPTRMRIALTMRAVYMGPVKDMTEYTAETFAAEAAVPFGEAAERDTLLTYEALVAAESTSGGDGDSDYDDPSNAPTTGTTTTIPGAPGYIDQQLFASDANYAASVYALNYAKANVTPSTRYNDNGSARYNLPHSADCSGLVVFGWKGYNNGTAAQKLFGTTGYPGTDEMINNWERTGWKYAKKISLDDCRNGKLRYGDLLIKRGHVRFFDSYRSGGGANVLEAASANPSQPPQVGMRTISAFNSPYIGVRPMPFGADMNYNATQNATTTSIPFAP